ncbi:hypothetical protein [Neobacillus cucumis]|uniref:Uncharacterized protein n=1 Tax=Neobacillus cucumis TaxID=1740721 RepID=A0A2N5H7K5_9BACI|nr:hypothetical protein [Neobacillus cucumis]PLS01501.1 hypothetical protein CVD27_24910 [Neobacillus cucumis]
MKIIKLFAAFLTVFIIVAFTINHFSSSSASKDSKNKVIKKEVPSKETEKIHVSDYSNAQEALDHSFGKPLTIPSGNRLFINVPSKNYPTIQTALDDLKLKKVERGSKIEISLKPGIYDYKEQLLADGLNASLVDIKGQEPIKITSSGVHAISHHTFKIEYYANDYKNLNYYDITYNVSSVVGITPGQFVIIKNTSGAANHYYHQGAWEITDVDSKNKRITVLYTGNSLPPKEVKAAMTIPKTVIRWTKNTTALLADHNTSLGSINNVVFVGTGRPEKDQSTRRSVKGWDMVGGHGGVTGIIARNGSEVTLGSNFAISSFSGSNVYATQSAHIDAKESVSSSSGRVGFGASSGASIQVVGAIASGNLLDGIVAQDNSFAFAKTALSIGNHRHGFVASGNGTVNSDLGKALGNLYSGAVSIGSTMNANSLVANNNGENGLWVYNGGKARAVGLITKFNKKYGLVAQTGSHITASNVNTSGNSIKDIYALDMSNILVSGYVGPSTFEPPLNITSKDGSYIKN